MGKVNQPSDLISQFRQLKRFVMELSKRVGLASAVISRGGLKIIDGGSFELVDADGTATAFFGQVIQGDDVSTGWIYRFDDEGLAFTLSGSPGSQFWALYDSAGNIIASNDAASGAGLARPYLNLYLAPSFDAVSYESLGGGSAHLYAATASTSAVELWKGRNTLWQPRIRLQIDTAFSFGSDANWRLLVDGVDASGTVSGAGTVTVDVPGWGTDLGPGSDVNLSVEGWLSGDPGRIGLMPRGCYGLQS